MERKLFGTDGIRGIANQEPMTAETFLKIGRAIAYFGREGQQSPKFLIGKDTRISGDMLESALVSGLCSMGIDTFLCGILPTPAIAYLTSHLGCNIGAVISASHNPYEDNGIKFFTKNGFKLSDAAESRIEQYVHDLSPNSLVAATSLGRITRFQGALDHYVSFLKEDITSRFDFHKLTIVLDCANGAAYEAGPAVFGDLGVDLHTMFTQPNGCNINLGCGSLHLESISDAVIKSNAQIGIALDGDADRVIFVDERGRAVNGDQIMGIIAADMKKKGSLKKDTVVATVMSNMGLEIALGEMGINLVRTPVGDRYVVEKMLQNGFNFGGEQSGHIIFLDKNTSGDGLFTALQVIQIVMESGKPLSELASQITMYPQVLKNVQVRTRRNLDEIPELTKIVDDSIQRFKGKGRLLIRYSGTQLLCRVMAEGEDEGLVQNVVETVANAVAQYV